MKTPFILYAFLILLGTSCKGLRTAEDSAPSETSYEITVDFIEAEELGDVVEMAREEGKLVFIDVYADWCHPCKLMNEQVYSDEEIGVFMNEHFISWKVDVESGTGSNLVDIFGITVYPTLLYLNPDGYELERFNGAVFGKYFVEVAQNAIGIYKNQE